MSALVEKDLSSSIGIAYEESTVGYVIPVRLGVYLLEHFKEEHPDMVYRGKEMKLLQDKVLILRPKWLPSVTWASLKSIKLDDYLGATLDINELEGYSDAFVEIVHALYDFLDVSLKSILVKQSKYGFNTLARYENGAVLSGSDREKIEPAVSSRGIDFDRILGFDYYVMAVSKIKHKEGKVYIDFNFLQLEDEPISLDMEKLLGDLKDLTFDTDFSEYTPSSDLMMFLFAVEKGYARFFTVHSALLGLKCALNRICAQLDNRI